MIVLKAKFPKLGLVLEQENETNPNTVCIYSSDDSVRTIKPEQALNELEEMCDAIHKMVERS